MEKQIEHKTCSKCGETKPKTLEFFPKRDGSKDGFRAACRICNSANRKNWYEKNRDQVLERVQKRAVEKRDELCQYYQNYYQLNSDKVKIRSKLWLYEKLETDPFYKMKCAMRCRIRDDIKNKRMTTESILGCDWNTFKEHIESLFQPGMTWENYGRWGWHYDHKIPVSSAKNEEELLKLNHYTNFQPLWAFDNLSKHNKISEEWGNA